MEVKLESAPSQDEIEVSVFGPGYGESILIHFGEGEWIIVDSCIDQNSKKPTSLTYLRRIGVNPAKAVKQVIATHWHDDHISIRCLHLKGKNGHCKSHPSRKGG